MGNFYLLSALVWLPIISGIVVLLCAKLHPRLIKFMSLSGATLSLFLCWLLLDKFDLNLATLQLYESFSWLPTLGINYSLAIDGLSLPLVLLTCFITWLVIFANLTAVTDRLAMYLANFLIMSGLMIGVFLATDAILFYIFFEAMLVPMFLIIGIWGGSNRIYATIKFFLYTFLGSIFLLIALIYLNLAARQAGFSTEVSFAIGTFQKLALPISA